MELTLIRVFGAPQGIKPLARLFRSIVDVKRFGDLLIDGEFENRQ